MEPFEFTTDALDAAGVFDPRYTCDMDNSSPELRWSNAPPQTASFALLAEERTPFKEPQTLWVIFNIPPQIFHLPTGIPPQENLPNGIRQGINGLGKLGYTGPCPPQRGGLHEYVFQLFALSATLDLPPRANRALVLQALSGKILATAEFAGKYQRLSQKAG